MDNISTRLLTNLKIEKDTDKSNLIDFLLNIEEEMNCLDASLILDNTLLESPSDTSINIIMEYAKG
ncbi:MAG: hypothetical protein M9958_05645 [Chitinophagales bacterium]|nr:hypothetical protein [Chitinophagales bacterium]